ncbi:alpha-L-fucosidase [Pedobacter sp. Du54]|uniref:alpha-L-fucosidase n=1 Tax=Pedobacter anseongensis TaxID=3133439 RepID=UPI003096F40C
MKFLSLSLLFLFITFSAVSQIKPENLPLPSEAQLRWHNMELTMFVHFGPATWQDHEYDDLSTPLSRINPTKLSTDQWAKVAQSYGAKMIIFVAKHTGGFCWWQTNTTEYGVKNTPWKNGEGDVMKDLAASCKKYGLKLGVYLSPEDRYLKVAMGGKARDEKFQKEYETIYKTQLKELLTQYGPIHEVWVDGSLVFSITDIIKQYAPEAVILQSSAATIRWVGNEMGFAPYPAWNAVRKADAQSGNSTSSHSDPNGDTWLPIEVDVSLRRPNWFWTTKNESLVLPLEELVKLYYFSVGRGAVFLINVSPDTTGLIPQKDVERLAEFGNEIKKRFGNPLAETKGEGEIIDLNVPKKTVIDHITIMEDIAYGERVRDFKVQVLTNQKQWKTVFEGTSIGHKLIIQFPEETISKVRLNVNSSIGKPKIKSLKAYYTGTPLIDLPVVKDNWNIRNVGEWDYKSIPEKVNLKLNLSEYLKDPQAYEVAFVFQGEDSKKPQFSYDWSESGLFLDNLSNDQRLKIIEKHLIFDHVNADQYLLKSERFPDRVHFNLTGIAPSLEITVTLDVPKTFKNGKIQAFLLRK